MKIFHIHMHILYENGERIILINTLIPERQPLLMDTSVKWTLGSVSLVSVLKRFDCIIIN